MIDVPLLRLDPDLPMPQRMRAGDAAADLSSSISTELGVGQREVVPTGFAIAVPEGMCALVMARSGMAANDGVSVLNGPGLVDSGYRGELKVILQNNSDRAVTIERGQRIAQLMVLPVPAFRFVESAELPSAPDDRGVGGFGSSGR